MIHIILKFQLIPFLLFFIKFSVFSQVEKKYIRDGNKYYSEGKYEEAEKTYQKALEKNSASVYGKFNKADALYRQQKFEDAAVQFGNIANESEDKKMKAKAYHNMGNSFLKSQKLKESVDAYKNSLRNNPEDEGTRKNLAYALRMLQQQQQQQQQNDKNEKQDNKDQNQEQKNDQKKEEKNQENKEQQKEAPQEGQPQEQKKDQLSKQDAQRLLESMNNDEKKLQEKIKKEKLQKVQPIEIEKDW